MFEYNSTSWAQKLKKGWRRIAGRSRAFTAETRRRVGSGEETDIRAERLIWMFGSGRTGSTWLSSVMAEMKGQTVWPEPLVGSLFGDLYYVRARHRIDIKDEFFVLAEDYKDSWHGSIRRLVLGGAAARFPEVADNGFLVIKEPNGSIGAPLLMQALPESRMILLIRDPRDVVASTMDARREGSWLHENRNKGDQKRSSPVDENPDAFASALAKSYLQHVGNAKVAYDDHRGYKVLVKYEDLRVDTLGTMKHMYEELGIQVDGKRLARAVEKHAWENIPEKKKGQGKFYRKAEPGGWREDLTPQQVEIVESITAPLLHEFYPA